MAIVMAMGMDMLAKPNPQAKILPESAGERNLRHKATYC